MLDESVRRTLLMSYMAQGVYTYTRRGYFHFTLFQVAFPVNRTASSWYRGCPGDEQRVHLVSNRELGDLFESGEELGEDFPFEDLLWLLVRVCSV